MLNRSFWLSSLVLAAAVAAPLGAFAADGTVGGKGPRMRAHDGRLLAVHERPLVIQVDEFAAFGQWPVREAPPLEIRVVGDVEITPQPDGGLRIRFLDDADE